jgi:membrane protein
MNPVELFKRAERFLLHDLWKIEPRRGFRRKLWYTMRTGVLVVENSITRELFVRSAALSYQIVFSIIPLFAVMLALMKAFGRLDSMAADVRDFLLANQAPNIGPQIVASMNDVIEKMNARVISIVGFIVLMYTSVSLLSTIEDAFNRIWGVARPRGLLRKLMVYWTMMTIGPLLIAGSLVLTSFVKNRAAYRWILENLPFANATILFVVPFLLTWVVFTAVYKIVPHTRVTFRAALIGALVAGTAWEILKRLFVLYNAKVTGSYEVYGSLAAIPIFLLWIYLSWVLVLMGAEVAFAAQHVRTYRRETEVPKLSHAFKERLAIHYMVEIARDFIAGRKPGSAESLSDRLKVPVRAGSEVLALLGDAKLLHEMESEGTTTYVPSEDLNRITLRRIVDAVRRTGDDPAIDSTGRGRVDQLFATSDLAAAAPLESITLRELAEGKS